EVADRSSDRVGVVSARDGRFRPLDRVPEPYLGSTWELGREFARNGEVLTGVPLFDDMGKGEAPGRLISAPYRQEVTFEGPGTVWYDSRVDRQTWTWHGWDMDGDGLLAIVASGRTLELVRFDQPRRPARLAVIHRDAAATSTLVYAVWDSGGERPDVLFWLADPDELIWYSGTSDRTHTLRRKSDPPAFFGGWWRVPRPGRR
ncbi:MAG: hypothetical protein M3301_01620, partial [Chloroflexota bacterium]|nr:hypothetical protein [Chloroflexota bacterium]